MNRTTRTASGHAAVSLAVQAVRDDRDVLMVTSGESERRRGELLSITTLPTRSPKALLDASCSIRLDPRAQRLESVTTLTAQLAERHAQVPGDAPLHRDPPNPILDGQADPLVLRRMAQRQQVDLARIEVLRVELEVAVGVLVDAAREQREEDGDALLRDLLEARVVFQG